MEIYKASILRLKALNKHKLTHIMYIEMENVISNFVLFLFFVFRFYFFTGYSCVALRSTRLG